MKELDLSKTVYELCSEHPGLAAVMREIGFENITKPGMLQSAGKVMTIPKGCRMRKVELEKVIDSLEQHGFKVKTE